MMLQMPQRFKIIDDSFYSWEQWFKMLLSLVFVDMMKHVHPVLVRRAFVMSFQLLLHRATIPPCKSFFHLPMYRLPFALVVLLLLLYYPSNISAQVLNNSDIFLSGDDQQSQIQRSIRTQIAQSGMLALEGAIDPNEYSVGPGDIFALMIGGVTPVEIPITVSVSGLLILPEVGSVNTRGRSLLEVVKEATEMMETRYANAPVSLSLVQARSFYVHVTGSVLETGRYLMLPRSRISDVVHQALSSALLTTKLTKDDVKVDFAIPESGIHLKMNDIYKPALRNIKIQHLDGTEDLVDFTRYQTTGNTDFNPVLRDGDRVNVPAYHPVREGIRVSGGVAWPGVYDWRPDDTVENILNLANGGRELDESVQFRLIRWNQATSTTLLDHSIKDLQIDSIATFPLIPEDHITVYEPQSAVANILGWVAYPGEYVIEGGTTTVSQLVALAGGLKEGANLKGAVLERTGADELIAAPSDAPAIIQQQSPTIGDDMTIEFAQGFQRSFSGKIGTHVAADIAGALNGTSEDIVLFDGDRLIFPRDEGTVYVTGHVPHPGFVNFIAGKTAKYYIERAGGVGPATENIYVYGGSGGLVRRGANEVVLPGDAIFVGWLEDLTVRNRQIRFQRTQLIVSGISVATGLAATIIALFR